MTIKLGKFRKHVDNLNAHILSLRIGLGVSLIVSVLLFWGWKTAPERLVVHIPPDLSKGARMLAGEIGKPNVYTFGSYIFQQVNRWTKSGSKDYGENIQKFSLYLTDSFAQTLIADQQRKGSRGELSYRTRMMYEPPQHAYDNDRVDIADANTWVVWVDFQLQEYSRGMNVKDVLIRYPLRVVRLPTDWEGNPFGLALDGYWMEPYRLSDEQVAAERASGKISKLPMQFKKEATDENS